MFSKFALARAFTSLSSRDPRKDPRSVQLGLFRHRGVPCRLFTVLAVESSADDTCAAVVTSSRQILSNVVIKQHDLHEDFGGIHPTVAIEGHQRNMPIAVQRALHESCMSIQRIDGIAFTRGPGIGGCLSVGSNAAKTLAAALGKPLVGVHHMQAHALTPLLTSPPEERPQFPFLTLLVSGGHTLLVLARSHSSFRILANTVDESVGRTYDKVARMLKMPWGARGPAAALEEFCRQDIDDRSIPEIRPFSVPMPRQLAFSFSGLHSAVERHIFRSEAPLTEAHQHAIGRAFQDGAARQLSEKLVQCHSILRDEGIDVRHVVVSGGVASNLYLRARLRDALNDYSPDCRISLIYPPIELCTDNAAMIGWASMHRFLTGDYDDYSVELRSKWSIETISGDPGHLLDQL
ncbi:glycoprotease family-domain-containing protein [Boletus reticuloceps]|uniref:N(6)-L-threonylcarbamoyladenine synthase n=1 Tax=Boletus reticuloceps TaxID=495285 RepID=A0A8I2YCX5_9AGAM|nr:glycoprotease family-domain-containing protein [Boletus reticuloceps]